MTEEDGYENIVSSSLSRFIKGIKPHVLYLVPLGLLIILMTFAIIKVRITYESEIDVLLFWGLYICVILGCGATVGILQLIVGSKRAIIPGVYFNTTRGMEKGDVKAIGKIDNDKDSPNYSIYAGLGGYSQVDIPTKKDFYVGVTDAFEDWGKVEYFPGDPSRYEVDQLPEKIRKYFVREYEFNGSKIKDYTVMPGYDRRHSKIYFSPIGYDPKLKQWRGEKVAHHIIQLQEETINKLRNALDLLSKARPETPPPQPVYESRYLPQEARYG